MACAVCGDHREVLVHESWSGKFQSTCNHGACHVCLCRAIDLQLDQCRKEGLLRIKCFHEGCNRIVPQRLVLNTSVGARALAEEIDTGCANLTQLSLHHDLKIDWHTSVCPVCNFACLAGMENDCGHVACETCWRKHVEGGLPNCSATCTRRVQCFGCKKAVGSPLWNHLCDISSVVKDFDRHVASEMERLSLTTRKDQLVKTVGDCKPGPTCNICYQRTWALITNSDCGDVACEDCWAQWADTQIDDCRFHVKIGLRCIGATCKVAAEKDLWSHVVTRSADAAFLDQHMKRRAKLKKNALFPDVMQVNCPREGCVGLGYLGYDTIMCFICEHQWNVDGEAPPEDGGVEQFAGVSMKKCPKCQEYIEKNGGCDHMTCRCGFEFYWTTLKPYRNAST